LNSEDSGYENREKARKDYKPDKIRWLLVAEAPPEALDRFFYFEDVRDKDCLFIETMHALYCTDYPDIFLGEKQDIPKLRRNKAKFLKRFKQDGFYLIDALDHPIPQAASDRESREMIKKNYPHLLDKIKSLVSPETKVILIKSSVYDIRERLRMDGINVVNNEKLEFPCPGHQKIYRRKLMGLDLNDNC
jgi:hypothetical protein